MKSIFIIVTVLIMLSKPSWSQTNCIIPAPQHLETLAGEFVITSSTVIVAPEALASQADIFSESVKDLLGRKLSCSDSGKASGNIFLKIVKNQENAEAYELNILPSKIEIKAWSTPENRNWDQFRQAADRNIEYLRQKHVNVFDDNSLK